MLVLFRKSLFLFEFLRDSIFLFASLDLGLLVRLGKPAWEQVWAG